MGFFLGFLCRNFSCFAALYSTAVRQCPDGMTAQGEQPLSRPGECQNIESAQFPPASTNVQEDADPQRGQRFREIKPVPFKLLVYFGRPITRAVTGNRQR